MGFLKSIGKSLLHVGCGSDSLPQWIGEVTETRLDVVGDCNPDIVANMTDMGDIGTYDIVFCRHALEHLPPHDVNVALSEFLRVLNPGGTAIIFFPDLEGVEATDDILMDTPSGPIAGLDLIYGFRKALKEHPYMAHRTGFVSSTLETALKDAGFSKVVVKRMGNYDMMGVGVK